MKYLIVALLSVLSVSAVSASTIGGGGPTVALNQTSGVYEMVPQCFPWAFRKAFLIGDVFNVFDNQQICRENRKIDFGI